MVTLGEASEPFEAAVGAHVTSSAKSDDVVSGIVAGIAVAMMPFSTPLSTFDAWADGLVESFGS